MAILEHLKKRLAELIGEHQKAQHALAEHDRERLDIVATGNRIAGAIELCRELLAAEVKPIPPAAPIDLRHNDPAYGGKQDSALEPAATAAAPNPG